MILQTKILVIEDDLRLAKTIRNVLTLQNYDVCCADNGASGIQKAFEFNPDLILCDIKMDPVDGYQVYNVLKESSLIDHTLFIFITGNSDLQDIRFGLDLGADDYFIKPFDNEKLIRTIEKRLEKYRKLKDSGKNEFKALYNLTPNGLFLFDGYAVFDANPALIQMLGIPNLATSSIEDIIDPDSYRKIKDRMNRCTTGLLNSFCETVTLVPINGEKVEVELHVSAYEKYSGYSLLIGLVIQDNKKPKGNEVVILDVFNVLKMENGKVTESLGEKLINIFKQQSVKIGQQKNDFFTKRENQVLCLSMEGLPIKMIAKQLSISDRTVENHRANLMQKTNSNNIIEVIAFALRNNLIDLSMSIILFF
jgi:DNA-binding NarL/FixJ family response regulator